MLAQLGKYTILEEIGKGSMGTVYKAKDQNIGRIAAIKTIKLPDASDSEKRELVKRFKQEAMAAGNLNHPNIVVIYEYDEVDDIAYIAMEYIEGVELKKYFDNAEVFAQNRIIEIMTQLLDALDYSHRRGVIHRDIKPSNIMITAGGQVKITDFGIARLESSELTQAGSTLGTPSYMSPEQCTGQTVDARSDIFSAGVLLYQLLTGDKPFTGPSITAIMHKITQVSPPPPSKLNFGISPGFDPILEQCLAKRPEDRYARAAELSKALSTLAGPKQASGRQQKETNHVDDDRTVLVESIEKKEAPLPSSTPDDETIAIPLDEGLNNSFREQLRNDATVVASIPPGRNRQSDAFSSIQQKAKQTDAGKAERVSGPSGWLNPTTYLGGAVFLIVAAAALFMMKGTMISPPPGAENDSSTAAQPVVPPGRTAPAQATTPGADQRITPLQMKQQDYTAMHTPLFQEGGVETDSRPPAGQQKEPDTIPLIKYRIVSEPAGATVELAPRGLLESVTPMEIGLPAGTHQLYVTKAGYHDMSIVVDVKESGSNRLEMKLLEM